LSLGFLICWPIALIGIWQMAVIMDADLKRAFQQEAERGAL
jgi:hypothetical protein